MLNEKSDLWENNIGMKIETRQWQRAEKKIQKKLDNQPYQHLSQR